MQLIDPLITASFWTGLAYLVVGFVAYSIKRQLSNQMATSEVTAQVETAFSDCVVPFKRSSKAGLTDAELIRFAKSIKFSGASKWAKTRKLSPRVRAELLQQMKQSA